MNITGYKNNFQRGKAEEAYKEGLATRAKLNDIYLAANKQTALNKEYNITPLARYSVADDEEKDVPLQNEKAMDNLRKILKVRDAGVVLDKLRAQGELPTFNRFFNAFEKDLGGQTQLSPMAFGQVWDRYKEKLLTSGDTGIFNPSQSGDVAGLYKKTLEAIDTGDLTGEESKELLEVSDTLFKDNMNKQLEALYSFLRHLAIFKIERNKPKFDRAVMKTKKEEYNASLQNLGSIIMEASNEARSAGNTPRENFLLSFIEILKKINENIKITSQPRVVNTRLIGMDDLDGIPKEQLINIANTEPGKAFTKRNSDNTVKKSIIEFLNKMGNPTAGLDRLIWNTPQVLPKNSPFKKRGGSLAGQDGCKAAVDRATDRYYEFGNYLIHIGFLERGFLQILYPSKCPVKEFPKVAISSDFISLLYDILENQKFNAQEYEGLEGYEKELFDKLITFCKIPRSEVQNLTRHKKITDKSRDQDIKRFNLLKGELLAGNDSNEVVKELKSLLIKLNGQKVITRSDYNTLMSNLVFMT